MYHDQIVEWEVFFFFFSAGRFYECAGLFKIEAEFFFYFLDSHGEYCNCILVKKKKKNSRGSIFEKA